MGERLRFVESLGELQKSKAADIILPGIYVFLEDILAKECLSEETDSFRRSYVALLKCSKQESREALRRRVHNMDQPPLEQETCHKSSKLGQVREKKLINIRQFQIGQKHSLNDRMESESSPVCTTDDESRTIGDEKFVEFSQSEEDLLSKQFGKIGSDKVNSGYLFHKETDGLRRRWCVLEDHVLKCFKRQNQNLLFEVDFRDGDFSAIQGRIGKMFAIRLSGIKATRSYLFASPKPEICASWLTRFSSVGVQLQDDILRKVSVNNQNNNKVTWALEKDGISEKDTFRSDLLEALELIERSRSPHILPKRSSYSFKELDVLKKLKASLVSKKTECKLNRRKTWSAGSFSNNIGMVERFREPISVSDGDGLASEKETEKTSETNKSLPEILTSSGIVKVEKQNNAELGLSLEAVDPMSPSEDEVCFAMSLPEGLDKHHIPDPQRPPPQKGFTVTKSVPDLLILPGQECSNSPSGKPEKSLKQSVSLTRVMSMRASQMKNAIITGFRKTGRRHSGRVVLDRDLADIHGRLYRKKGIHWKHRWCIVMKDTLYVFRDVSYESEDFQCSLRKCIALRTGNQPGRAYTFKLIRRKGEEILMAAEDNNELERWMEVIQRHVSKQLFSDDFVGGSRSSSLTTGSYLSVETSADSSTAEDTPAEAERGESCYCETTDKDSSDEANSRSTSLKLKSRGSDEKGYMYYLVGEDTWEHSWVEVTFGVLSIYSSENKERTLQRDRIAVFDIQEMKTDGQRSYSFVLKRPGRNRIYLEVDSEREFLKWSKCFKSWSNKDRNDNTGSKRDILGNTECDEQDGINLLAVPRLSPVDGTPATSDSDCASDRADLNKDELERPKIRRSMNSVLSQLTPRVRRRNKSTAGVIDIAEINKNAVKSSFLYFKANSGLWVKYWCVLESSVIFCFNSPEEAKSSFTVDVEGCDVRRTSQKTKNFTFEIFNRVLDNHFEFAGESTYVMYAWMRVLKIAAGLVPRKDPESKDVASCQADPNTVLPLKQGTADHGARMEVKRTGDDLDSETTGEKERGQQTAAESQNGSAIPRVSISQCPTSPKRKAPITSLDQVLKLLHEKRLEQQLQNKEVSASKRAKMKWQHAMLVVLRKTRAQSISEGRKQSVSAVSEPEKIVAVVDDEKTTKEKYREISEKYDHMLEEEKLKMLRRETLLKKRRNSLILRHDFLEKKRAKCRESEKVPMKKRQSKLDLKEAATLKKSDIDGVDKQLVEKQLVEIKKELDKIHQEIDMNSKEQKKISDELNEKKRKELHELCMTADMSPQTSKSNIHEQSKKLTHRRQVSETSLSSVQRHSEDFRKYSDPEPGMKPRLTQSLSSPSGEHRAKSRSFSSSRLPKAPSSPLLRTKTYDSTMEKGRPTMRSRASQEALSLALSKIEDFEAFVQGSCRNNGADVGC